MIVRFEIVALITKSKPSDCTNRAWTSRYTQRTEPHTITERLFVVKGTHFLMRASIAYRPRAAITRPSAKEYMFGLAP